MNKTFDRYASFVFLLLGIGFMWQSAGISSSAYGSTVGPNIFPFGLGLALVLLSIRLFFEVLKSKAANKQKEKLDYKRFGIIFGAAFLYAFFIEEIGYVIGTFLFLLIGFQTMEKGKWIKSIIISAVFAVSVYVIFVVILEGTMPGFPSWLS
ncbi:tripartite tricarboxylate transporter TctB family protein [Paenibacillus sp. GSMTC-2017]|uniref:tripartite tricarboxylate transporter TctB family protein n=1 Tax=Paenibacillus sp. GSMTC-2017 TaxID=2794350 RepID=UPI0018D7D782|nr:tripartite tricarboxylate transporter TctB family protein [Paenibacillus sp. GSMTC-2017]MBH5319675.1 tripartite tricarboxylate transporter TctB family protein [Paenibacillus sp. GSMTC-2017]